MHKSLKSLAVIGLMGLSFNAFSLSESYLLLDNGTINTLRSRAPMDSEITFLSPSFFFNSYNLKVAKSHYLIDKHDTIYTLSSEGLLFEKKFYDIKGRVKEYGGSFFTSSKNDLYVITKKGFIIRHSEEKDIKFKKLNYVGGNFMVTKDNKLIVVRADGTYIDMSSEFKNKAEDIISGGDNYFLTKDGMLYSIGEDISIVNGKESTLSYVYRTSLKSILPSNVSSMPISVTGGNYFFDYAFNLHTISSKGVVDQNILGRKLMVENLAGGKYSEKPQVIGSSYFSFKDGIVFQVADDGLYYELGRSERSVRYSNYNSFEK